MSYIDITPVDSLFFRDSSPFNAGEVGQMEVASLFPPYADTVVGALRAALARAQGWQSGKWGADITKLLGCYDDLGPLGYRGPYLLRHKELLLPAPRHLLLARHKADESISRFSFLSPSEKILETDIGAVQLPERRISQQKHEQKHESNFKVAEDAYLSCQGMQAVLAGDSPAASDFFSHKELWSSETRAGIARDNIKSVVREGQFYQSSHTRLHNGVSLCMEITDYAEAIPSLATLGGESRMVSLKKLEVAPNFPTADIQVKDGVIHYTVTLLTPTKLVDNSWHDPALKEKTLADLPGSIISACVGKPKLIGGWDSVKKEPKKLEPYLPAGSIFFMKARAEDKDTLSSKHLSHIGERQDWGYGQILIGNYPHKNF